MCTDLPSQPTSPKTAWEHPSTKCRIVGTCPALILKLVNFLGVGPCQMNRLRSGYPSFPPGIFEVHETQKDTERLLNLYECRCKTFNQRFPMAHALLAPPPLPFPRHRCPPAFQDDQGAFIDFWKYKDALPNLFSRKSMLNLFFFPKTTCWGSGMSHIIRGSSPSPSMSIPSNLSSNSSSSVAYSMPGFRLGW